MKRNLTLIKSLNLGHLINKSALAKESLGLLELKQHEPWFDEERRWEDNIKMDLEEMGGGGGDWM